MRPAAQFSRADGQQRQGLRFDPHLWSSWQVWKTVADFCRESGRTSEYRFRDLRVNAMSGSPCGGFQVQRNWETCRGAVPAPLGSQSKNPSKQARNKETRFVKVLCKMRVKVGSEGLIPTVSTKKNQAATTKETRRACSNRQTKT